MSPSLELQGAIVARLKAAGAVTALVGQRIYDAVPGAAAFPYVSMGPKQALFDDIGCRVGFDITMQIDVWSRAVGYPEAESIAEAVRAALHDYDLPLASNALVSFEHRQTQIFRDQDGLTNHGVVQFVALVEQP